MPGCFAISPRFRVYRKGLHVFLTFPIRQKLKCYSASMLDSETLVGDFADFAQGEQT